MIARILRVYSYLYHFVFSLFLLGLAVVDTMSPGRLHLEMAPWKTEDLVTWLTALGIAGLVSILLAITGWFRFLFPIFALVILALLVRGFLLQPYVYSSREQFYSVLWLIAGALVAFIASLTLFRRSNAHRHR